MASDWFDPFGMRRITDAVSTSAARSLVGRRVEVDALSMTGVVSQVREAAPASSMNAMLSGQLGLWRRLDVEFADVRYRANGFDRVRVDADEIRAIEALPQRIGARSMDIEVAAGAEATRGWIETLVPVEADVRVAGGEMLARLPGLGRFGDVILDPWWHGRRVGVRVERARVGSRRVAIPQRLQRRFEWELEWLPDGTTIHEIAVTDDDGVMIRGRIDRYSVELDVARLLADLTTRQTGQVIDVLLGG
ncbi:MAG: hypothetical protein AAF081_05295 [Actinomycetota bacterium]